jgi:alpha-N-arabinofuranosidase
MLAAVLLACSAATASAQIATRPTPGEASITVDLRHPAANVIPRTLFGSFLEPIGNSTYNGLWAEILENPSFEAGLWDVKHVRAMVKAQPELARASELGLPLPWSPLNVEQGNRYEYRYGDDANSARALELMGVPGQPTGIKQRVYLPVPRELTYRGSIYVRHLSGEAGLSVSLRSRRAGHAELAAARLNATPDATPDTWTKIPFTLTLEKGTVAPLEPVDFVIMVNGAERVLIDQVSLMPADALDGLDPEMVQAARDMHTPLIRFGGNFTSGYHWQDGVGPRDKRISMPNVAWGIPEYNSFGTDEFLHFCKLIDAEPQIALNLGSGTPEEGADWVRYVNQHWANHQGGLLWELGNELWGTWNTGWPTLDQLAPRTLAFSKAIRAVDPSARLIATGQDPDHFEQWNAAQLANQVGTENYLSTHFVETTTEVREKEPSPEFVAAATFALPVGLERRLRAMHDQIDSTPQKGHVQIAFTEWLWATDDAEKGPRFDNMAGAVTTAGLLNALMRSSEWVPISDMTGIVEFAGIWKKRGQVFRTPAAYALGMFAAAPVEHLLPTEVRSGTYSVHNGSTRLPEIPDVPYLDVDAAVSKDGGTITLFVVNRSLNRDLATRLNLAGVSRGAQGEAKVLSSRNLYSGNDEEHREAVVPVSRAFTAGPVFEYTFPRASLTVLSIPASR